MISELDKRILRSLNENARKSFREVAKEVGTSTTSIYNNVKKLEKMGVIRGYIPLLNEEILGNEFVALIMFLLSNPPLPLEFDEMCLNAKPRHAMHKGWHVGIYT